MERDLILAGLRWQDVGTKAFTWRDLFVLVRASQPGSALYRAMSPEGKGWAPTDYILADAIDAVRAVAYTVARSAGNKSARPPKPYPRPGVKDTSRETQVFKTRPMPIAAMRRWLGWDKDDDGKG